MQLNNLEILFSFDRCFYLQSLSSVERYEYLQISAIFLYINIYVSNWFFISFQHSNRKRGRYICVYPPLFRTHYTGSENFGNHTIVTVHDCSQTRLCSDMFMPGHNYCTQAWLCSHDPVHIRLCPYTTNNYCAHTPLWKWKKWKMFIFKDTIINIISSEHDLNRHHGLFIQ